jgi:hypothetical protein
VSQRDSLCELVFCARHVCVALGWDLPRRQLSKLNSLPHPVDAHASSACLCVARVCGVAGGHGGCGGILSVSQLVPLLLPAVERKSVVASKLLREVLANAVLQVLRERAWVGWMSGVRA